MADFSSSLSSPASQNDFRTKLYDITSTLNSIQHYVDVVSKTIADDPCFNDKLAKDWHKIAEKFTNKRWKLKDTSAELEAFIEELATAHLPKVPGYIRLNTAEEVKEDLDQFHGRYHDFEGKSRKQSDRFSKLLELLNKFKDECEDARKEHNDEVESLNDEIARLQKEREEITKKIRKCEVKLEQQKSTLRTLRQPRLIISHFISNRLESVVGRLGVFYDIWFAGDQDIRSLAGYVIKPSRETVPLPLSLYQHPGSPVYSIIRKAMQLFAISPIPHRPSHMSIHDTLDVVLSNHNHSHSHSHSHTEPISSPGYAQSHFSQSHGHSPSEETAF